MNLKDLSQSDLLWKSLKLSLLVILVPLMLLSLKKVQIKRTLIPQGVDSYYLPSSKTLHFLSLGQDRMVADLIWIRSLIYFGDELSGRKRQTWLFNYLKTVIELDPYFENAYEWAGAAMVYGGAIIDKEAITNSNYFYAKGLEKFPDNWNMAASLGFNYAYELKPKDPALRKKYRRLAIDYFMQASKSPDAPPYVRTFAINQMSKEGMKEMTRQFLKQSFAVAMDKDEEKILENRMKKVMGLKSTREIKARKEELENLYENTLPYASDTLFYILGPQNLEPFSEKKPPQ